MNVEIELCWVAILTLVTNICGSLVGPEPVEG